MPLSEEEMRLLEQMERALVHEDPKLAHALRGTSARTPGRRQMALAASGVAAGLAVLMAGAYTRLAPLGVLGFVIMLAGVTFGLSVLARRRQHEEHAQDAAGSDDSFLHRMEDRFRRHDEDDDA